MKPAQIFHQYIWIINTLKAHRRLTLEEISRKWQDDGVADGNPLVRSSFNRHRDAILDMFGIVIECDPRTYEYYIFNPEVLNDSSIERWLFSTLTVHGVLADSASVKEYVVLENVPAGEEYLETIIRAIRTRHRLLIGYKAFGAEGYEKTLSPYSLKLDKQRWYLLTFTGRHMATYALDRMTKVELTDETFEMPADFSPQAYFSEYFGVLTDETPMAHIVVRAHNWTPIPNARSPARSTMPTSPSTSVLQPISSASCSPTVTASRCSRPSTCAKKCARCSMLPSSAMNSMSFLDKIVLIIW